MKKLQVKELSNLINYPVYLYLNNISKSFLLNVWIGNNNKKFKILENDILNSDIEDVNDEDTKLDILKFLNHFNIWYKVNEKKDGFWCSYRTKKNLTIFEHQQRYTADLIFNDKSEIEVLVYLYMTILIDFSEELK